MADYIARYVKSMERQGLAHTTIVQREIMLRTFERELGFHVTQEEVESWLDRRDMSLKTRSLWVSHLKCFYRYCSGEGFQVRDPTIRIKAPKTPRRLPRPMPSSDLQKALEAARPVMRAWLLCGALAGLRCQEIAGLRADDVMLAEGLLRVTEAKGGKERLVPLHPQLREALERVTPPFGGLMWKTEHNRKFTANQISWNIGRFLRKQGITGGAHTLRHSFASNALRQCHDLRVVQELLGHASVATTAVYTAFDQDAAKAAVAAIGLPTD
jgi:site-specific recombinase XerD